MALPGNIFLIGPMGVGKSTIGRHLAECLGYTFFDSDHEIERRTGAAIPLIFAVEGEEGFRRRESAVIDELTQNRGIVLATGGGAVLAPANRTVLRDRGCVVYLQADLDTLYERTRRDRHRPLLQTQNPRAKLQELIVAREPLYKETAHVVATTDQRAASQIAREIAARLRNLNDENTDC